VIPRELRQSSELWRHLSRPPVNTYSNEKGKHTRVLGTPSSELQSRSHTFTFSRCHVFTFSRTHEAGGAVVNALQRVVQRSVHPELGDEQPGVILEPGNENTFLFLNVSHVCPEPVSVN